ncbi:MAG: class I SAM-dependent methyltransferase [Candidatus Micrarchaeota archaeon]
MVMEGLAISRKPRLRGPEAPSPESSESAKSAFGRGGGRGQIEGLLGKQSMAPDDAYIEQCYSRVVQAKAEADSNSDLRDRLGSLLTEVANRQGKGSYSGTVVKLLMRHWLERDETGRTSYDGHMEHHTEAIRVLFSAWVRDRYSDFRSLKILDASCGSGKVLEAFLDSLPVGLLPRVQVVANDISISALEATKAAMERFEGQVKMRYSRYDISREMPPGSYDVVLFSQTLGLISDDKMLRGQRLQQHVPSDNRRHIAAKTGLLAALHTKAKRGTGEVLIVDEDPMQFSKNVDDFDDVVEDVLFREIFRPISKLLLIEKTKKIPHSQFLADLECIIDREHAMYLIASKRVNGSDRAEQNGRDISEHDSEIVQAMERMHPVLVRRFEEFGNGHQRFKPIPPDGDSLRLVIDYDYYRQRIQGNPSYWVKNGGRDLVIVSGLAHEIGLDAYTRLIENLRRSKKAGPGAALLFIDTWPMPQKKNAVRNSHAREAFESFQDHEFVATYRSGTRYGYLYVIKEPAEF